MKNNNLKILFVLNKANYNPKKGKAPLRIRITYDSKRKVFSENLFINPDNWKNKQQKAHPPNEENNFINTQLSLITQKVNQAFLFLQVNKVNFDVEDIYLKYKGEDTKQEKTILEVFETHNKRAEKLIGKDYVLPTIWKFKQSKNLLKDFIQHKYKKSDYLFKDLTYNFITEYEFYLKTEKKLAQSTTCKAIQRFRKIIKIALAEKYLQSDPFLLYKCKRTKTEIIFLTTEELKKLEKHKFKQERLQIIKDLFVFCCYTGLAFKEMSNLNSNHIVKGFDKNDWIQMKRKKTKTKISIPLLPKANKILKKYNYEFPHISNHKFNSYLKEIADIVGINKHLTHHIARKTFATTVLLYNGVPMEIVSELLGHSNMNITQAHYGKIVQIKVSKEIDKLR
ncbi:site-specific integrase [Tenacibaculum sp. ZH5_bin.1]|uniref:site-specific integrase n=1 Tax=Tenacibaculum TaxID=104267 RepID=UPI001430E8A0|nr:site-specific integrase [Tenacibaculum mesophilum]KAF9659605.1 site-specific integrase [Tenacibaculum mesophilum]